jgi:hypothetical protein
MQLTGVSASEGPTSLAPIDLGLLREFVPSRVVSMVNVSMVKFVPGLHRVTLPLYTNVREAMAITLGSSTDI